jgi:hypothetical protein
MRRENINSIYKRSPASMGMNYHVNASNSSNVIVSIRSIL